ncbi:hypothetical protein ACGFZP_05170 [Kitasatospora sp. NPDC048239]|uniref:hypothetical protein n=1 Tax=Kitasatospora sp. NPDC048239 TaxID=3364046 RepID=UPI003723DE02
MADVVKLEPGDVLILSNLGDSDLADLVPAAELLTRWLGGGGVYLFSGNVDISKLSAVEAKGA